MMNLKSTNSMAETMEMKKAMTREEVMKVSGGDLLDCITCVFRGHDWEVNCFFMRHNSKGQTVEYKELVCSRCGTKKYKLYNFATGKTETISKKEYDAVY